jgi:LysM repeat protein
VYSVDVRIRIFLAVAAVTSVLLLGTLAQGQSLNGSRASVNLQESQAVAHDFTFLVSPAQVNRFVNAGLLVKLEGGRDYELHDISYPYARPAVKLFIERLSNQFRSGCGERLTVTSLTRPVSEQPSNASDQSVHPTGMALDLRIPRTATCLQWLTRVLLSLEGKGLLEATRERNPAHFHVAIFPGRYEPYVASLEAASVQTEYVVRRGDSLSEIARRIGSSVAAIVALNGINGDRILAGQVIRIPN